METAFKANGHQSLFDFPHQACRVLVVDDDRDVRDVTCKILKKAGYNVVGINKAPNAIAYIHDHMTDIIICDVMMPEMDGFELCKYVRSHENFQDLYFIFLTAKAQTDDALKGFGYGADDYLRKPFDSDELLARIHVGYKLIKQKNKLKYFTQQLANSELLASMASVSASMSHELNSPLGALMFNHKTMNRMLSNHDLSFEEFKDTLGAVLNDNEHSLSQIKNISQTIKDFHHYGKQSRTTKVHVIQELDTALQLLSHKVKAYPGRIVKSISQGNYELSFHEGGLIQIFTNLLTNALDACGEDGSISIKTVATENMVRIDVSDNGPGIPEDVLPHIFEPLFTTKSQSSGTGFGLAICKQILEKNAGTIEAHSEADKGTLFTIKIKRSLHD